MPYPVPMPYPVAPVHPAMFAGYGGAYAGAYAGYPAASAAVPAIAPGYAPGYAASSQFAPIAPSQDVFLGTGAAVTAKAHATAATAAAAKAHAAAQARIASETSAIENELAHFKPVHAASKPLLEKAKWDMQVLKSDMHKA